MGDVERFFAAPTPGDSGAPHAAEGNTPSKRRKSSMAPATSGIVKKKKPDGKKTSETLTKDPTGQTAIKKIQRPLSGFNLAGRPGILQDQEGSGIKSLTKKFTRPISTSTINTDTEWSFVINSKKNEFFRFFANSLTVSLFLVIPNANHDAASAVARTAAENHSTVSLDGNPRIFFDPSIMATSLVKSVRVSINGVPVQTNSFVDPHLQHYVRCCRIFNSHPEPYFARQDQLTFPAAGNRTTSNTTQKISLRPFDHVAWNDTRANRVPIYLDGIWPFDHRNRTVESIDKQPEPPLYLPPDSRLEITVELHRNRFAGVFHNNCYRYDDYFGANNQNANTVRTTIEDVLLEYESCELSTAEHDAVIKQYREGKVGNYDYDIVRSQHQPLDAQVAYCVKWFQLQPHCRLVYLLFLPNHAIFPMPATNKPISAWSRFPTNCTSLKIGFAGADSLITENLENFGLNAKQNEISKKIFYDYLTSNNMFVGTYDELFSNEPASQSIIQILPIDLKHLDSTKTERLTVELKFSNADLSPAGHQILCLSVHTNGRAVCSADPNVHDWKWEFKTL